MIAWNQLVFRLCSLLNLGGDAAVLGRGKLVVDSSQFVRLINITLQDVFINVFGTLTQGLFLQRGD